MRYVFVVALLSSAAIAQPSPPVLPMSPRTMTNEEQVYFENEAGRTPPPWIGMQIAEGGGTTFVDQFGNVVPPQRNARLAYAPDGTNTVLTLADGRKIELRRARPVTCWASLKKDAKKPDGSDDWYFVKEAKLHDQGGRVLIGKDVPGVKPVVLRMRNVTWSGSARSSNRPSLVLYIHTPDQPDHALSYVWADPGASRIGVNLRWMQASCTVDGMERPGTGTESRAN